MPAHKFEAIGTVWSIETTTELSQGLIAAIDTCCRDFTHAYSRFEPTSLVRQAARHGRSVTFPHSIEAILNSYELFYKLTDGRLSPLVGYSMEALGYDASYSLTPSQATPAPPMSILSRDGDTVSFSEPALLDIGALGKGFLIDEVSRIISKEHLTFTVDGSGDMFVSGREIIGLQNPSDTSQIIGTVVIENEALCGSAITTRAWGNGMHHIIDATTGSPVNEIIATWAIADTAMVADGLATAVFLTDPAMVSQKVNGKYIAIHRDGTVSYSQSLKETGRLTLFHAATY